MGEENRPKPETELDEALEGAWRDPARPNEFYDSLLNAEIFMPVRIAGKTDGSWQQVGMKDRFHPYFLPKGENKVVPIFDRLERLQEWAQSRAFDYAHVKCHLLLGMLGEKVGLVLNPRTRWSHSLSPETLDKLRRIMKPIHPV